VAVGSPFAHAIAAKTITNATTKTRAIL
jgi:hypothetical protein